MIDCYAVMIKDGAGKRWMDSCWVTSSQSISRFDELKRTFAALDLTSHTPYMTTITIQDAMIEKPNNVRGVSEEEKAKDE